MQNYCYDFENLKRFSPSQKVHLGLKTYEISILMQFTLDKTLGFGFNNVFIFNSAYIKFFIKTANKRFIHIFPQKFFKKTNRKKKSVNKFNSRCTHLHLTVHGSTSYNFRFHMFHMYIT